MQILGYLNFTLRHFAIKNNSAGYFDKKLNRFRKHSNPYAVNGSPDIYCWIKNVPGLKGVVVGLEVKSKNGTQSDAQIAFERSIKEVGGHYFVVRSIEDVEVALDSIGALKAHPLSPF